MGRDRGKYNKRGGRGSGRRNFQVTSADEIDLRNARIAEFDERRTNRRYNQCESENENTLGKKDIELEDIPNNKSRINNLNNNISSNRNSTENIFVDHHDDLKLNLTRRQREAIEKEKAEQEYRRKHALGLTEEYKRDMEKLTEIRKRRELRAQEERHSKEEREKNCDTKQTDTYPDDQKEYHKNKLQLFQIKEKKKQVKELPKKLDRITIKKMKPTQLKELLKERGLNIQGNSKALTQRLLDHEAGC